MLVLNRRGKDAISFPQVGISIRFIEIESGNVKIGIEAPSEITIDSGTIHAEGVSVSPVETPSIELPQNVRHAIRNEIHAISLGLGLYTEEMKAGLTDEAESTFELLQDMIRKLDNNAVLKHSKSEASESSCTS